METTKIQSLTPQGTFEAKGKTFYKFDCILENGMVGEVNALSPDKWSVGQDCVVKEHQHTKWGVRLKLDRPGFDGKSSSPASPAVHKERQDSIVTQWAIREAQQYVFNGTTAPDKVTLYDIWGVAKHFKAMHDNFDTWGGIYKQQTSARAQQLAPENCPPVPEKWEQTMERELHKKIDERQGNVPKMAQEQMDAEFAPDNGINDLPF